MFADLRNELTGGRGAASGTVSEHCFMATFGCNTILCAFIWNATTKPNVAVPIHLLWTLMFLIVYATESVLLGMTRVDEKTYRKWIWMILRTLTRGDWVSLVDCRQIPT